LLQLLLLLLLLLLMVLMLLLHLDKMQLLSLPTRDGKRKRMRRNPDPSKKPTKESRKKHPGNKRSWTHNQDAQPSSVLIKDMRKEKKLRTKSSYSAIYQV